MQETEYLLTPVIEATRIEQPDVLPLHSQKLFHLFLGRQLCKATPLWIHLHVLKHPNQLRPGDQTGTTRLMDMEGYGHEQGRRFSLTELDVRYMFLEPGGQESPDGTGV